MLARGELQITGTDEHADDDSDADHVDDAAAAFGLVIERPEEAAGPAMEPFHLLPENVSILKLWMGVQTQWRNSFAGPTGLDYAGVRASPALRRVPRRKRERAIELLCAMERAVLDEWGLMREREDAARR